MASFRPRSYSHIRYWKMIFHPHSAKILPTGGTRKQTLSTSVLFILTCQTLQMLNTNGISTPLVFVKFLRLDNSSRYIAAFSAICVPICRGLSLLPIFTLG